MSVNKNMKPSDILQDIKVQMLNIGETAYLDLVARMDEYGKNGKLTKIELTNALTKSGVFLSLVQLGTLMRAFDPDKSGQLSVSAFCAAMQGKYSERRLSMLRKVFNALDTSKNGTLDFKEMVSKFRAENHPSVEANLMTPEVARDELRILFEAGAKKGQLSFDDFCTLYKAMSVTIPKNDDLFCEILSGCWGVREQGGFQGLNKDSAQVRMVLQVLREKIRQKTRSQSGNAHVTLLRKFRFFDGNKSETANVKEFALVLDQFGVTLDPPLVAGVFNVFATNGELEYKPFIEALFGELDTDTIKAPRGGESKTAAPRRGGASTNNIW